MDRNERKKKGFAEKLVPWPFLFLFVIALPVAFPFSAAGVSYSVDCYGTLEAWRSDPNYQSYVASCYCPSAHSHPVCGGGGATSGTSTSAGSGGSSHDFSLMVAETFLTAMLTPAPEPKGFSEPAPPAVSPNPVYARAWKKLQEMRLPADKASFLLGEALRSGNQAVSGYEPGDVYQQLVLARCLSQSAAKADSMEEASWLLRQGSFAFSGGLVEAFPGSCPPVPEPPGAGVTPGEPDAAISGLSAVLDLVERKREEMLSAREEARKAGEAVSRWKEITRTLAAELESAPDEKAREEKKSAMEEALKMLAESEKLEADAEQFALESEKALGEAEATIRQGEVELGGNL